MAVVIRRRPDLPVVTMILAAGSVALFLAPAAADLLVYERERVLAGEGWRLVTGPFVHFSTTHLAYNVAVLIVAGAWLECRCRAAYLGLIALTTLAGSLYALLLMPDMARFGGLSGVVSALVVALALHGIRDRVGRPAWIALLLLFTAKVAYEFVSGETAFATADAGLFSVVPEVHLLGAASALVVFSVSRGDGRECHAPPGCGPS